jgi:hypothetical protein
MRNTMRCITNNDNNRIPCLPRPPGDGAFARNVQTVTRAVINTARRELLTFFISEYILPYVKVNKINRPIT